ncbi:DUF6998 domain-containing protein [Gordonia sp. VNK21]|uniref:DUF6998 domain-containing protein n=1 Tax=Gordonia sp. VNK21 TaxID=3382483 RepID=UPI0038D3F1AA
MDLTGLGVQDLLRLEAAINTELRRRGLVRTSNKPLGDVAEAVVHAARGGVLEPNSTKSHDITTPDGRRIQVKAMGVRSAGAAAKFSPFRSTDFTTAVFLVFDRDFDLTEAREVTASDIEQTRLVAHINGRQPSLSWVRSVGTDVTAEMQQAWRTVDAISAP